MPDLANRREHEDALTAAVLLWWSNGSSAAMAGALASTFEDAAGQLAKEQDWDIGGESIGQDARGYGVEHASVLAAAVSETTRERLAAGEDPATVQGEERARAIGVTETTRAISAGEDWAAAAAVALILTPGVTPTRTWHTAEDELVCEECEPLDGEPEDEWQVEFPMGPPAHPNCRCWIDWGVA